MALNKTLHTKFGTAQIGKNGYYSIYTVDKGHEKELLHRAIFEDFYNMKIPKGYVIHHKDGNKLNNCILNLQMLPFAEHIRLHNTGENNILYGKTLPLECKLKISNAKNTTGYFRVYKRFSKRYKQGFKWVYQFHEDGKLKSISSVDIDKLEEKVIARGLEWIKLDGDDMIAT